MPTVYDGHYRPVVRHTSRVKGQLRKQSATATSVERAASDLSDAANVALYPRRYARSAFKDMSDTELKQEFRGRSSETNGRRSYGRPTQFAPGEVAPGEATDDGTSSVSPTQRASRNDIQVRSARGAQRDGNRMSETERELVSAPPRRKHNSSRFAAAVAASNEGFLPAGAFSGLVEKVDVLNSFTNSAFDIGTLTFDALAPAPPAKAKRKKNSRYDVSPRQRGVRNAHARKTTKEIPRVYETPREREKQERIHEAITMRRRGETKDGYRNTTKATTKHKKEKLDGHERLGRLKRMQAEQDRLSQKKADLRKHRMERQREKKARRLELEKREKAAIKLQGLCRGRRDRIRVRQLREQRKRENESCRRIQALQRGKRGRARAKDKRDRDAATRRIQSLHRGRNGRKQFQERKEREMATRRIQAIHRGRNGRKRFQERKEREAATRKIQALHRGKKGRNHARRVKTRLQNEAQEREIAVRKIQAINRGHRDRRRVQGLREERKDHQEKAVAARKIQARIRGKQARQNYENDKNEQSQAASKIQARIRGIQQRRKQGNILVAGATHPEGVRLVAMIDFKAEEEDDLDFVQGDILIGYSLEEGWWSGVKEGNKSVIGDFPSDYVVREGEEAEYELEVDRSAFKMMEAPEGKTEVPDASAKTTAPVKKEVEELPLDMLEWLVDWTDTFKIKGVEELGRALNELGVGDAEDLKDLDDDMVEEACASLKKLDAKKFRRAIEGERDTDW